MQKFSVNCIKSHLIGARTRPSLKGRYRPARSHDPLLPAAMQVGLLLQLLALGLWRFVKVKRVVGHNADELPRYDRTGHLHRWTVLRARGFCV